MKILLTIFVLVVGFGATDVKAQESKVGIQLIIDESGVISDPEEAGIFKMRLLAQLKSLLRKRDYATARLDVISTSMGRTLWVGELAELKDIERAEELIEVIETKPNHCNNLGAAFRELDYNLAQRTAEGYDKVYVLVFSSLINTPRDCGSNVTIKLPQPPPKTDIASILTAHDQIEQVSFYWVNPHQKFVWLEKLDPAVKWLQSSAKKFEFHDIEASRYALKKGSIIEVRR